MPGQFSSRHVDFVKSRPNEEFLPLLPPHGDISHSASAFVHNDQHLYVTDLPQIHDLDHSSRFKSETRGEMSAGVMPRKDNESDFPRTAGSDAHNTDMPVRRPLRPW